MQQQPHRYRYHCGRIRFRCACLALIAVGWLGADLASGQHLPAALPTGNTPATQSGTAARDQTSDAPARYRADVQLRGDQLEVRADNSSLNQILRTISQQTGMTITGGVKDQRVFGTYGPGPAAQVISELLEDTGVNMLLKMTPQGAPAELILTQRTGGPSPPGPSVAREDPADAQAAGVESAGKEAKATPEPTQAGSTPTATPSQVPPLPFSQPPAQPAETDPFVTPQTPSPGGIVGAPTVAPATEPGTTPGPSTQTTGTSGSDTNNEPGTNPASPNGVKTPQQIYQELQKLLQQQQQQQNSPANSQ